jgi:hypothetical protein
MTKLVPVELEDGAILYIEAQEDAETVNTPPIQLCQSEDEEQRRGGQKGIGNMGQSLHTNMAQSMNMVQNTIRTYTLYSLNAFKNMGSANVDEVTLEFGINLSADAGVPYIASGKAQSNLKITVKCTYPNKSMTSYPTNGNARRPESEERVEAN